MYTYIYIYIYIYIFVSMSALARENMISTRCEFLVSCVFSSRTNLFCLSRGRKDAYAYTYVV